MRDELMRCCLKSASKLKPCLCDQSSTEDAIIDVYIQNQTQNDFCLVSSETRTFSGQGFVEAPGEWIVKPPQTIKSGKTIFFRAYSGRAARSTTDEEECFHPVQFIVEFKYISPEQSVVLSAFLVKTREGVSECSDLKPFSTLDRQYEYSGEINVFQNVTFEPNEDINGFPGDFRWQNTAFLILSNVTSCKKMNF